MPLIRLACRSDALPLAVLQEQTFRDTYSAANTVEDMNLHCRTYYSAALQEQEILNQAMVTLVCEEDTHLIGFVQLRWNATTAFDGAKRSIEIQRFYIDKNWHGKGVAQQLMQHALSKAKTLGADYIWLGVWEKNPRALRFYQQFEFVEIGESVFTLGNDPQRDIVVRRSL